MDDLLSLSGSRVLITGGTRGIGRAIAWRFAAAGALVVANYVRNEAAAQDLKQQAQTAGHPIDVCRADVSSEKGIAKLLQFLDTLGPSLSVFVHCAATGVHRPIEQLTARHFEWTYATNVRAFLDLVRQLLPKLQIPASVLAVSSEGADRAVPQYALVGSSKGALESLVRHLAVELAPRGIRVNSISPGTVLTGAWKILPDGEQRLSEATRRSPLGRLITAEEVAWAAQFLCSRAASGVVGETLVVDGGFRIVG